jgi:L-ascorbate metabolism protein UlaG (beta-lactamase superfamily)
VPLPPRAAAGLIGGVDAVLLSHLHLDHCDLPSLRMLRAKVVIAPPGSKEWLTRHRVTGAVELAPGEALSLSDQVTVTAAPAHHPDHRMPWGPVAQPVGHVVQGPQHAAWFAGDTSLFPEMAELPAATRHGLDLAVVPIWGWGPTLGLGHLDPQTAAEAVVLTKARHAIPVHWGTLYPFGLHATMRRHLQNPPTEFTAHLATTATAAAVDAEPHVLRVGDQFEV